MGTSLSSPICTKSIKQILQDNFNCFDFPSNVFQTTEPPVQFENGSIITVNGNGQIKGNLYVTRCLVDPVSSNKQLQSYFYRYEGKQSKLIPIVKIHAVKEITKSHMCSQWKWYYVITEELVTFDKISNGMTYQESLYSLFQCLMGFFYLYLRHFSFEITQKMITVNKQGKIKVWLNQNFAENHPLFCLPTLQIATKNFSENQEIKQQCVRQWALIQKILDILNQKSKCNFKSILLTNLGSHMPSERKCLGFRELLNILCIYEERNCEMFIPNALMLQKQDENRLKQRQSFSIKLQKAIDQYQVQNKQKVDQQQKEKELQSLGQTDQSLFKTGKNGNTMPTKSRLHFSYNNSNLVERQEIKLSQSHFNTTDIFNTQSYSQILPINIYTYKFEDSLSQLRSQQKDLHETYYKSYDQKSFQGLKNSGFNWQNKNNSRQNSQNQWGNLYEPQTNSTKNRSKDSSFFPISEKYKVHSYYSPASKGNECYRISQQAQEDSYRQSLVSIRKQNKTSFPKNQVLPEIYESEKVQNEKIQQQQIYIPTIESQFVLNHL